MAPPPLLSSFNYYVTHNPSFPILSSLQTEIERQMPAITETMPGNPQGNMVEAAAGVSFSVFFFDGEKEINIGSVAVFPSTTYKNFQSILSNKIGISPNQFSIYLCKNSNSRLDSGSRIPITGKVNFSVIMKEKYGYFLAVLRRRKSVRRQRGNREWLGDGYDSNMGIAATMQPNKKNPPANMMLLRRNTEGFENQPFSGLLSPILDQLEYEKRNRNLQMERERYLVNMGLANLYLASRENEKRNDLLHCTHCLETKMIGCRDNEFHCCVHDLIVFGFRSVAGPITRPTTKSLQANS